MKTVWNQNAVLVAAFAIGLFSYAFGNSLYGQAVVPGTGVLIAEVGDDFEDPSWTYNYQLPKTYNAEDTTLAKNSPLGESSNGRWYEGQKRGQPDSIRIVSTPAGGLSGSSWALAIRSQITGGSHPSYQQQQDDLIGNVAGLIGKISVSRTPSVVARVWLPPLETWERRSGCHFAYRIALETNRSQASTRGLFRQISSSDEDGIYWPGFFLNRELKQAKNDQPAVDRAYFWLKASSDSRQIKGPEVTTFGWWTLGMSVTPDGQVHYFAKPGVEDLNETDRVASSYPFGYRAILFRSFFFNVCNGDDGRTWSTEFVVDDPKVYVVR